MAALHETRPAFGGSAIHSSNPEVCSCGHDSHHYMVTPSPVYGLGGWLRVFIGISTTPKAIRYECRRCGEVIEETTDPSELDRYY